MESLVLAGLVDGAFGGLRALVLVEVVAGLEEVAFGGCEGGVAGRVLGGDEAAAAEQHRLVAVRELPVVGGGVQGAAQADDVAVLVDPFDESWPFAQEGFVGDFEDGFAGDGVDVGDEEPVGEEPVDDGGVDTGEFVAGGASAQVVVVVAGGDELGEQQADVVAVAGGGVGVELFGAAGDGAADAAEFVVGVGGDDTVDALFEQFGERELQQGQRARVGATTSPTMVATRPGSKRTPARSAGRVMASWSSVEVIGVTAKVVSRTIGPNTGCCRGRS